MNKINTCIYLICRFPFFNPEETPAFETFDAANSLLLYSSLVLNYHEILEGMKPDAKYYLCLDERDKNFIPEELNYAGIIWRDTKDIGSFLRLLNGQHFINYSKNIIILADSMGISSKDINKAFNLLSIDDDAIILGKTHNNKICFVGFNSLGNNFFDEFNWKSLDYNDGLNAVCKQNSNVQVIDNFILIEDINDFKKLYTELSKKDSLAYCSPRIHERFTNIFIEYKGQLK